MDWYDVEDILYDGTKEEIQALRCPDCGGNISYNYDPTARRFSIMCKACGMLSVSHGGEIPNCYRFIGPAYNW